MERLRQVWQYRWLRFVVMGAVNTGFSYGVYALLVFLGLNYAVSNFCSLILGILFSFRTQGAFVFRDSQQGTFFRYIAAWVVLYVFNILVIGGLMKLHVNAYVGGALAIVPTAALSYFLQKYFVFTRLERA